MKGDFSRDSFDPFKHFTRVLQQQGRVQLDADWNEQAAIFWHYLRKFTKDLLGPYAGPKDNCGFGLVSLSDIDSLGLSQEESNRLKAMLKDPEDFLIGPGDYYVDGLLCENHDYVPYSKQPDPYSKQSELRPQSNVKSILIFLDVWERHLTFVEDDSIREVALGGTDTASRAKLVWQARHHELTESDISNCADVKEHWDDLLVHHWQAQNRGLLKAKAKQPVDNEADPCVTSPESRYRGTENQLYRVEIHRGGVASTGSGKDGATFKWSRENGAVVFPVASRVEGDTITLANLGRDARFGLEVGDWVEICDDDYVLHHTPEPLLRVEKIDAGNARVTLSGAPASKVGKDLKKHPLLRRWDQKASDKKGGLELHDGAALLREGDDDKSWFVLEDGIQVQFNPADPANRYRRGDYWVVPARTATGDVIWPQVDGKPRAEPPRGIEHHYAPLGIVTFDKDGAVGVSGDCRLKFRLSTGFGA
jgi:hypothetical protein